MSKNLAALRGLMLAAGLAAAPASAGASCKLLQVAEFKLDPNYVSAVVDGSVNGHPTKVLLDTGSDFSEITYYEIEQLKLPRTIVPGFHAYGVGGNTQMYLTHADQVKIGDLTESSVDLAVAGDRHVPSEIGLVIGDDVLSKYDLELDLAHHAMRMFKPQGCTAPQLVYWGAAYSQAVLQAWNRDYPAIRTEALVNGRAVAAQLDSGATSSIIDASAAAAAGVTAAQNSPAAGAIHGSGPKPEDSWVGRFDSFALGDEKIGHVNLQVVHIERGMSDTNTESRILVRANDTALFLGADFLHAHRVMIDNDDHLILFSYEGGPVFSTGRQAPSVQ